MNCQFCNKLFSSKSSLNNHQKTAKFCLKLQDDNNKQLTTFNCEYCCKLLTSKQNLNIHLLKCKNRLSDTLRKEKDDDIESLRKEKYEEIESLRKEKDEEIESLRKEKDEEIESLRKEKDNEIETLTIDKYKGIEMIIKTKTNEIETIRKDKNKEIEIIIQDNEKIMIEIITENKSYKEQIKYLQQTIEKMSLKAIEKPTTTNTTNNNNTLNITSFMDFNNIDKLKNVIEDKLNINYVVDGQKGLANFVKDTLLTDDNGKLLYICTDPSRNIFKYKDSTGEVKKDVEAKKLTNYILEGGIRKKSAFIGNEWCKDDRGKIDKNRFDIMMEHQQSIMKLTDDNTSFKKELVALTS